MNELRQKVLDMLTTYLKSDQYPDIESDEVVIDFEEKTIVGGYCETCYFEDDVIVFTIQKPDGTQYEYTEYIDLAEILKYANN